MDKVDRMKDSVDKMQLEEAEPSGQDGQDEPDGQDEQGGQDRKGWFQNKK